MKLTAGLQQTIVTVNSKEQATIGLCWSEFQNFFRIPLPRFPLPRFQRPR